MVARLLQPVAISTSGTTLAYPSNVTRGSLLIAACGVAGSVVVSSDTIGNTWTLVKRVAPAASIAIYYAVNKASGPNTVTIAANGVLILWEAAAGPASNNVMGAVPVPDQSSGAGGTSALADPGAITPTYATSICVSYVQANTQNPTAGANGWTFNNSTTTGAQSYAPTIPASQDGTFTLAGSSVWAVVSASFGFVNADAARALVPRAKPFLV